MTFEFVAILLLCAIVPYWIGLLSQRITRLAAAHFELSRTYTASLNLTGDAVKSLREVQRTEVAAIKAIADAQNAANQAIANKVTRAEVDAIVSKAIKKALMMEAQ